MTVANSLNLSASLEDYLEAILNLSAGDNVARSKDIAESLKVSRASVTGALRTLAEKHLINYKPYGFATFTEEGRLQAERVARKHDIIKSFFTEVLGIDNNVAQSAACQAEHALGPQIVGKLLQFMEFVTHHNENGYDLLAEFEKYCQQNKLSSGQGEAT